MIMNEGFLFSRIHFKHYYAKYFRVFFLNCIPHFIQFKSEIKKLKTHAIQKYFIVS